MTRDEISQKVYAAISGIILRNGDDFIPEPASKLGDDLAFDELDVVELMLTLEDDFGIAIDDECISLGSNVADIDELITAILREKSEREARAPEIKAAWGDFPDDAQ